MGMKAGRGLPAKSHYRITPILLASAFSSHDDALNYACEIAESGKNRLSSRGAEYFDQGADWPPMARGRSGQPSLRRQPPWFRELARRLSSRLRKNSVRSRC